jgi:hypothetical protein
MLAPTTDVPLDTLEQELIACEALISRARSRQAELLRILDGAQVDAADGSRSMLDWTAARLDVSHDTARQILEIARRLPDRQPIAARLETGEMTVDRALATARLAAAGATADLVADSAGYDLQEVRRLVARHRRYTRAEEERIFRDRYVVMQPNLDGTVWRLWGQLPGDGGSVVESALVERGDRFRGLPQTVATSQGQRNADALVAIAQDALDSPAVDASTSQDDADTVGRIPVVTVFVDAAIAASTQGEAGAEVAFGPRVGPETLRRILCEGSVQLVGLDRGRPVVATATTRAIPPAIRRFVLWRDGGCTVAGCPSRYRLQPHHIREHNSGGDHDPHNLTTLCWYHHHVAIHGNGFRIDPDSPPQQRRLIAPKRGPDPPAGST